MTYTMYKQAAALKKFPRGTMELTQHERTEFRRYAEACLAEGRVKRAKLLNWLADSKYPVSLRIYDKCKAMYRAWLVFNQF